MTFVESCLRGEVGPEAIYAFVDSWHRDQTPRSLPEYLGMTADEYDAWLEQPRTLDRILANHRQPGGGAAVRRETGDGPYAT